MKVCPKALFKSMRSQEAQNTFTGVSKDKLIASREKCEVCGAN